MGKKLISIIVPVLNEEENVDRAYSEIVKVLEERDDITFEIIFTDNHSSDRTYEKLEGLASRDKRVKAIRFTRNFGFNRSILEGYRQAQGDAAIQIDCDLQDPPSLFNEFIRLWQEGHDVVVGVKSERQESRAMVWMRRGFYILLNAISDSNHQVDAGDFRLIDRSILNRLAVTNDAEPYVRGLVSELATNQGSVKYTQVRRAFGKSKFPLRKLVPLGLKAIYTHSTIPLKLATYCGLFIAATTALFSGAYILAKLVSDGTWPAGFATTTVLVLFGISLNALFLGIIGEYVARIHAQVHMRPNVIIQKSINITSDDRES